MQLFGKRIFEQQQEKAARNVRGEAGYRLRAVAAVMLTLAAGSPSNWRAVDGPAPSWHLLPPERGDRPRI